MVAGVGQGWRAWDQIRDAEVVASAVRSDPEALPEADYQYLRRVERTARAGMELPEHPGLVAVRDLVVEGNVRWVVLDSVRDETLEERVRAHGLLSEERAVEVARAVLGVLAVVHGAGMVHGEISPESVLLAESGAVRLAGVGVTTGGSARTAEFHAPERPGGLWPTADGDMFSVGATLYWALTGQRYPRYAESWNAPKAGPLLAELLQRLLSAGRPRVSAVAALEFVAAGEVGWRGERTVWRRVRRWAGSPTSVKVPRLGGPGRVAAGALLAGFAVLAVAGMVRLGGARWPEGWEWWCLGGSVQAGVLGARLVAEGMRSPVPVAGWLGLGLGFAGGVVLGVLAYAEPGAWLAAAGVPGAAVPVAWSVAVIALVRGLPTLVGTTKK